MSVLFPGATTGRAINFGSPSVLDNIFQGGGTVMLCFNAIDLGQSDFGRFWKKAKNQVTFISSSDILFEMDFTTTRGKWTIPAPSFGVWSHLAITYDHSGVSDDPLIYLDGISQTVTKTQTPVGSPVSDAAADLTVGNRSVLDGQYEGGMEGVRFYDRELSASEILTIFNAEGADGIVDGLVLRPDFNFGVDGDSIAASSTISDLSPSKANGTTVGVLEHDEIITGRRKMAA